MYLETLRYRCRPVWPQIKKKTEQTETLNNNKEEQMQDEVYSQKDKISTTAKH